MAQPQWGLPELGNIRPPPASARGLTQKSEDSSIPIPPTFRSDRHHPTGTPHELRRKNIGQEFPSFLDLDGTVPAFKTSYIELCSRRSSTIVQSIFHHFDFLPNILQDDFTQL
jgi:hypothetical protein